MHVSESLDGRVIVFSVDYKNFKSFLIKNKEKLVIASPGSARILEASLRSGYQNYSDTQNVNVIPNFVNAQKIFCARMCDSHLTFPFVNTNEFFLFEKSISMREIKDIL